MKTFLYTGCLLVVCWLFSSCAALLGIKNPVNATDDDIIRAAKKIKVPLKDCYELDSMYLLFYLKVKQHESEKRFKDFSQPLQMKYYDTRDGKLQSFHINCYADRGLLGNMFSGLDWNKNGRMDQFPPGQQAPVDSLLSLKEELSYLRPLKTTVPVNPEDYDYIVVAYWNMYMKKHSRKLVKAVKKNVSKAGNKKVKVLYANNENLTGSGHLNRKFSPEDIRKYDIDLEKLLKPPTP